MWKWWIERTKLPIFAILSNGKKGSKKVQLVSKHCKKMSWIVMWHVLPPTFKQRLATNQVVAGCVTSDWIRLRRSHMTSLFKIILQRSWPRESENACYPWEYTNIYSSRSIIISFDNFRFEGKDQLQGRHFTWSLMLASDWAQKYFLCLITDRHSNKSWNWFVKSSIPGVLLPVLENFRRSFFWPNWPPMGLRGCVKMVNWSGSPSCPCHRL